MEIFGVSLPGLLSQLLLGLVNGSFYAILSLGLAVIFGLLNVINFAHGALFMTGALLTWMAMNYFGINYWLMLVLAPLGIWLIHAYGPPALFTQAPQLWWLLPGLGLLSALAFGAMMAASRLLPLGLFGILSYVEPVLLFGVAVLFLGETFAPQQLWTYLPIWLAVLLIGWDSARLLRKQAQQLG